MSKLKLYVLDSNTLAIYSQIKMEYTHSQLSEELSERVNVASRHFEALCKKVGREDIHDFLIEAVHTEATKANTAERRTWSRYQQHLERELRYLKDAIDKVPARLNLANYLQTRSIFGYTLSNELVHLVYLGAVQLELEINDDECIDFKAAEVTLNMNSDEEPEPLARTEEAIDILRLEAGEALSSDSCVGNIDDLRDNARQIKEDAELLREPLYSLRKKLVDELGQGKYHFMIESSEQQCTIKEN